MLRAPMIQDPAVRAATDSEGGRSVEEMMSRVADGDGAAFTAVYRALRPRVRGLLMQLTRERALADDLTQETFVRMYRSRASYQRGACLASWATAIARNLFLDHLRRARLRCFEQAEIAPYADALSLPCPPPDEELEARRMADELGEVIERLPARQAAVLRLVRGEGQSLGEAAAQLGCSEMAARLSAHRARAALRKHLVETWGVAV